MKRFSLRVRADLACGIPRAAHWRSPVPLPEPCEGLGDPMTQGWHHRPPGSMRFVSLRPRRIILAKDNGADLPRDAVPINCTCLMYATNAI
jgi:hypothetical protein